MKDGVFKCDHCECTFTLKRNMNRHVALKHENKEVERFYCQFPGCKKSYTRKSDLAVHEGVHNPELVRKYNCPHCDKSFIRSSDYHVHLRRHVASKPYKCNACDKSCVRKIELYKHLLACHSVSRVEHLINGVTVDPMEATMFEKNSLHRIADREALKRESQLDDLREQMRQEMLLSEQEQMQPPAVPRTLEDYGTLEIKQESMFCLPGTLHARAQAVLASHVSAASGVDHHHPYPASKHPREASPPSSGYYAIPGCEEIARMSPGLRLSPGPSSANTYYSSDSEDFFGGPTMAEFSLEHFFNPEASESL